MDPAIILLSLVTIWLYPFMFAYNTYPMFFSVILHLVSSKMFQVQVIILMKYLILF